MPLPTPRHVVLATLMLVAAGCGPSRPKRIVPPALDPEAVTVAVLAKADADGNGTVSKSELAAVPALIAAVTEVDVDRDGGISRDELRQWLDRVKESRIAITSFAGEVRHQRRPLANAQVKLVPESFMGAETKSAEGTTDADGRFTATIPNSVYPGVNCGLYRVEISGQGNDGKPLPGKYNSQTTLGTAVGGSLPENVPGPPSLRPAGGRAARGRDP